MEYEYILDKVTQFEKLAQATQYVYHIKSEFKGKYIYSLNQMKDVDPKVYKESIKKYKDRQSHITTKIDRLDCTWADVINLSTINPIKIFQLANLLGNKNHEYNDGAQIIQIPVKNLKDSICCVYDDAISNKLAKSYSKLNIRTYKEEEFLPVKTVKYFADCVDKKEDPLMFAYVKHILVKDKVDISGAKTLTFRA